jgi:A/G-specific adenine glycosylase
LAASALASRVVRWQASHGRNNLPWQNTRDPYRIWLSEVMLQQTQVTTVIGYFNRFLNRLPNVAALAGASADEVMGLWSGLGYYSRARNLHRCAVKIVHTWGGEFPAKAAQLETLPGIGRSTAAAIASLCFGERVAILDANVRRVVTRVLVLRQISHRQPTRLFCGPPPPSCFHVAIFRSPCHVIRRA